MLRMRTILLLSAMQAAAQAADPLRAAVEKAVQSHPDVPVYQNDLARTHNNLGVLLSHLGKRGEAETAFRAAIEIARRQRAKSWELRAAVRLGRLWQRQGKHDEALRLVKGVYDWFTEGYETADLRDARAAVDEMSAPP